MEVPAREGRWPQKIKFWFKKLVTVTCLRLVGDRFLKLQRIKSEENLEDSKKILIFAAEKKEEGKLMMVISDIEKLKAVTLYILKKCGATDYIHLFKILYFAEKAHYAEYGKHITKDTFVAMEHGPVPSFLYDALKLVTNQDKANDNNPLWIIANAIKRGSADLYYFFMGAEEPDMDELSKAEIVSLDQSIAENKDLSPWALSEKSHDLAWHAAWDVMQNSTIDPYKIAEAGGASEGFVDYLKEQDKMDAFLKGNG